MTTTDFHISDTRVVLIDANPEAVLGAVERLELTRPVRQAIESLGLADRLAIAPTRLDSGTTRESIHGMAWRIDGAETETIGAEDLRGFDGPGYVKVIWNVRVEAGGETGTLLSTTMRFIPTDRVSGERLRAAWGLVGPAAGALSKRALATIKSSAEDDRPSVATLDLVATDMRGLALAA